MKPRHAAAFALVGWCLGINFGKTVPKSCSNCAVLLILETNSCVEKFKTEEECMVGGDKYVQNYYVKADKAGDLVVYAPVTKCHEDRPAN